jgi:hypothetical protein
MIVNDGFKIAINRIAKTTPDYLEVSKMAFGSDQISIVSTDTDLTKKIPYHKYAVVSACDVITDWNGIDIRSLISLNTTSFKEGTGSLNIYKTSATSSAILGLSNGSLTTRNFTDKYISFWIYFKTAAILSKFNLLTVKYGTDSSNYYYNTFTAVAGWNNIIMNQVDFIVDIGSPDVTDCQYFGIDLTFVTGTDTIAEADIMIDDVFLFETADYYKDFEASYPTIDETNFEITYKGYLDLTMCNGFLINSIAIFNEDTSPLMQDIFMFPGISKSSTDELSFIAKNRLVRR